MTRKLELNIGNFRGISYFFSKIDKDIICLVGRGDSGEIKDDVKEGQVSLHVFINPGDLGSKQ